MNISPVNTNNYNRPSFGMALYMPTKEETIAKMGKFIAKELEAAKPNLEDIGKKVDLRVKLEPSRFGNLSLDNISFLVTKKSDQKLEANKSFKDKMLNAATKAIDFILHITEADKLETRKHMTGSLIRREISQENIVNIANRLVENFERAIE